MRSRFLGTLLVLTAATGLVGCAQPWRGFEWMFPTAPKAAAGSDEEMLTKMRKTDEEVWATGASDRSREIEQRLGIE